LPLLRAPFVMAPGVPLRTVGAAVALGGDVTVRLRQGMRLDADVGEAGSELVTCFLAGPNSTARARSANVKEQMDSTSKTRRKVGGLWEECFRRLHKNKAAALLISQDYCQRPMLLFQTGAFLASSVNNGIVREGLNDPNRIVESE
jgi:hypothetical protein